MDRRKRTELLKAWAVEAGFDRVGVARLAAAAHGESFVAWLGRGDQAAMAYMADRVEVRLDPRTIFAGATSALCVALQYHAPDALAVDGDLWPRVARYARGRDYHNVMTKRLRRLARRIEGAFPGSRTKPSVDTGPVLERDLAAAAGLGVAGKNTMLLHPHAGSYFFLGELFTSLDLEPELQLSDLCGSCSLCLEACPTGALPQPFRLDARRCISYWTIEHRGPIPEEMRPQLSDWVFGCDLCQEACPHNDRPRASTEPAFAPSPPRLDLDLEGLLDLSEADYREVFKGSPMKRSRYQGLRRNACVAMGNRGEARHVPALGRALSDADPLVRAHAAWALGRLGGAEATTKLGEAYATEVDEGVRRELESAIASSA